MDQERNTAPEQDGIHPETARFDEDGRKPECGFCEAPLISSYFELNGQPACEACRYKVVEEMSEGPGARGFFKAALAGTGAAAAGAGIYYAVLALSGYEVGLVAILVGFLVGMAVRWGSRGRGGWAYQTLAVGLTYLAIVGTYIPAIIQEVADDPPPGVEEMAAGEEGEEVAAAAVPAGEGGEAAGVQAGSPEEVVEMGVADIFLGLGALLLLAMALPFLAGVENLMGLAIIAVGLYEAWRQNKRSVLEVAGPFGIDRLTAPRPEPEAAA